MTLIERSKKNVLFATLEHWIQGVLTLDSILIKSPLKRINYIDNIYIY